jgi:DNA-binding CsgD family transcriptional regulator
MHDSVSRRPNHTKVSGADSRTETRDNRAVEHVRLLVSVVLLAPGLTGITVLVILRRRLAEPILDWVIAVIVAFSVGLLVSVVVYYLEEIARLIDTPGSVLPMINLAIVAVMYVGVFLLVRDTARRLRRWVFALSGIAVAAGYILFGVVVQFDPNTSTWAAEHRSIVSLVSVAFPSFYLGYAGWVLQRDATGHTHPTTRFLVRAIGWMLFGYAIASVVATTAVTAAGFSLRPTEPLNFILYVAWNVVSVLAFVRYLTHPVDLFGDEGIPPSALRRYNITGRESEVIEQLTRGLSNREIADTLHISYTTVRSHVYNIFRKTGASSRVELLRILSAG